MITCGDGGDGVDNEGAIDDDGLANCCGTCLIGDDVDATRR